MNECFQVFAKFEGPYVIKEAYVVATSVSH